MGYSEIQCQICSVSFAIRRIRTAEEPRSAAWGTYGFTDDGFVSTEKLQYYGNNYNEDEEHEGSGNGPDEDSLYEDDGFPTCMFAVRREGDGNDSAKTPSDLPPSLHPTEEMYFQNLKLHPRDLRAKINERVNSLSHPDTFEHIASPTCGETYVSCSEHTNQGYSGHQISVEEMRGCNTMQGLVFKKGPWAPEEDDEEFEKTGRYFLSGLVDSMTIIDAIGYEDPCPERHGCDDLYLMGSFDDIANDTFGLDFFAIPVHPTCVEVLKRVTLRRYGRVGIEEFTQWWELSPQDKYLPHGLENRDVSDSEDQFWQHNPGAEYLAANPLVMPGLAKVFPSSANAVSDFSSDKEYASKGNVIFLSIPIEIRNLIFDSLSLEDISKFHLASPFWYRHTDMYLKPRISREWPWLWEAWTDLPYSQWSTATAHELRNSIPPPVKQAEELSDMNWALVTLKILKERANGRLKGLKNRERIWNVCNRILTQAEERRRNAN